MQIEVDLALAGTRAAATVDVDDVESVEDRHVDRVARVVAETAEMRRRHLAQLHRVDRREAEVEDARAQPVLLRGPVLLQVAERRERGDVAVRGGAAEPYLAAELADAEERPS